MLSQADNEVLTRVGADLPMGKLLRHFWVPFLLDSDLPEPNGDPPRLVTATIGRRMRLRAR